MFVLTYRSHIPRGNVAEDPQRLIQFGIWLTLDLDIAFFTAIGVTPK